MASLTRTDLDLLKERRQELGLPGHSDPVAPWRPLMWKGMWLGALPVITMVIAFSWLAWKEGQQKVALHRLRSVEQRLQADQAKIKQLQGRTDLLRKENNQIVDQLVAIRASSALMEQLRRLTPRGVQLKEVSVRTEQIKITGESLGFGAPGPFERINAFALKLSMLPMVKSDGVNVVKVVRVGADQDEGLVQFSVDVTLDPKNRPSLQELRDLGASGVVVRYQLLQRQGVSL